MKRMAKEKKQRFHTKSSLLALYLSVGITGICMLAFSAWTPSAVRAGTSSEQNILQTEHTPPNSGTEESGENIADNSDHTGNGAADAETLPSAGDTDITQPVTPTTPATPTPTPTSTPTPTPNPLQVNAYTEVNELIEAYYDAKLSGEPEAFQPLVSDPSTIDIDYLQIQYGLITEFNNFTCYTKNGIGEVAYVVYVSYDSKIVTIDTPVPSLDRLTLVYAGDGSGNLLINTASTLSDEVIAYCDELFTHDDVRQMYSRETERFENAISSDPELSQLYNRLDSEGAD